MSKNHLENHKIKEEELLFSLDDFRDKLNLQNLRQVTAR